MRHHGNCDFRGGWELATVMVAGSSTQGSGRAPSGKAFFPYGTELASAARRAPEEAQEPEL